MYIKNSDFLVNSTFAARINSAKSADLTILMMANLATWFSRLKSLVFRYFSYTKLVRNSAFLKLHIFPSSAARTTRAYSARNRVLTRPES